jgi:hypothetical protein
MTEVIDAFFVGMLTVLSVASAFAAIWHDWHDRDAKATKHLAFAILFSVWLLEKSYG